MILCHVILTTTTKTVPILQIRKLRPSEVKEGISPITFQALGLQLHVVCTHFLPAAPSPEGLHSSQSSALIPSQRMLWGPTLQYLISSNSTGRLLPSQRRLGWDALEPRALCFPMPPSLLLMQAQSTFAISGKLPPVLTPHIGLKLSELLFLLRVPKLTLILGWTPTTPGGTELASRGVDISRGLACARLGYVHCIGGSSPQPFHGRSRCPGHPRIYIPGCCPSSCSSNTYSTLCTALPSARPPEPCPDRLLPVIQVSAHRTRL